MTVETKKGFLDTLSGGTSKMTQFAKIAAVIGGTFLSVYFVNASLGNQSNTEMDHAQSSALKQTASLKKKESRSSFWREFGHDLAANVGFGSASSLVDTAFGGASNTNLKHAVAGKQEMAQPQAKKVATQTASPSAVNMKLMERE